MADWIYRRENKAGGCVIEPYPGGAGWNNLIALDVSPEHGPLIALAPRMEALIRKIIEDENGWDEYLPICSCYCCCARNLIREIDAMKEAT